MASRLMKTKHYYKRLNDSFGHQWNGAPIKIVAKVIALALMFVHFNFVKYKRIESDCQGHVRGMSFEIPKRTQFI